MESQTLPKLLASGSRTFEALSNILSALRHLKSLIDEQVLHTCAGNVSTTRLPDDADNQPQQRGSCFQREDSVDSR